MLKPHALPTIACLLIAALFTGCAHRAPSNDKAHYQSFIETEHHWFDLLYADDMEGAVALVSEDFASEAYADKDALSKYMKFMVGRDLLTAEKLDRSGAVLDFNDTTANMGPYVLTVQDHTFSFTIDFALEETDWRIVGMNWARK